MEALRRTLVRQRDRQQVAVVDGLRSALTAAGKPCSPLNTLLAAAETLGATGVTANEQAALLLVMSACLGEVSPAAVRRCAEALEEAAARAAGCATAFQVLGQLFAVGDRAHFDNASNRARVLACLEAAVARDDERVRRAAGEAAGAAAAHGGGELRKSVGEWVRQQLAAAEAGARRDDATEERAVRAVLLLAGPLAPCLTPPLLESVMRAAAAKARPPLAAAAFRCVVSAATGLSSAQAAAALCKRLAELAPPQESSEARVAWTAAVGAAGAKWAAQNGEENSVLLLAERIAAQLGDAKLAGETGWALAHVGATLLARQESSRECDRRLALLADTAWSWPFRAGWKKGALRLLRALVSAGLRDARGAAVWGDLLARLEGTWHAAPDDRPLVEEGMGVLAQGLGGRRFEQLLPMRLGSPQQRTHLLPVLARHLQGTDLAYFGSSVLPVLRAAPQAAALLPSLCVLPGDLAAVWPRHMAPLLVSWLGSAMPPLRAAAGLCVSRAVASFEQVAQQQTGPLQLGALLRVPDAESAAASLAVIRGTAPTLLQALLASFLAHGERPALDAASRLAALTRGSEVSAGLLRAALVRWMSGAEPRALAVCEALLPGVDAAVAMKLATAILPRLAKGEKSGYRCAVALCRHGFGQLVASAPLCNWENLEGGAARYRLELRRHLLGPETGAVAVREALLGWRDCGPKARTQAEQLLEVATRNAADATGRHLAAALALPDPSVLSGVVAMMAHILRSEELREAVSDPAFWDGVCGAMLTLSRTANRELQGAVLVFWMAAVKAHLADEPEKAQALLRALWSWDEDARSHFRREMKVLVERLMKRAGPNAVLEGMKSSDEGKRLVQALAKKKRRKKKEYEKGKEKRAEGKQDAGKKKHERFLDPDVDDLLSTATSVSSSKPKPTRGWDDFEVDAETGKPLVIDPEDEVNAQRKQGAFIGDDEDFVPNEDEMQVDGDDDEEGDEGEKKVKPGAKKKGDSGSKQIAGGKMYKAKRAAGDLKKGKFDPFSYVKLDPKNLNKRRSGHTADQFSDMFQRKRPGVKRGHKHVGKKAGGRFYSK